MTNDLYSADKVNELEKKVQILESNIKILVKFLNDNRLVLIKKTNKLKCYGYSND